MRTLTVWLSKTVQARIDLSGAREYASYDETLELWRENKIPHKHTSNGLAQPREDVRT
jgi:hypothetical protein